MNPEKSLEKIEGTYSLVWYDEFDMSLNFARNKERPMYFCTIKNSKSIIFASEPAMIYWLATRNNIEVDKIEATSPGVLISIPLDEKEEVKEIPFKPYEKKANNHIITYPVKKRHSLEGSTVRTRIEKWTPYNIHQPAANGYLSASFSTFKINVSSITKEKSKEYLNKEVLIRLTTVTDTSIAYGSIISIIDSLEDKKDEPKKKSLFKVAFGKFVDLDRFKKLTKNGCSVCSCSLDPEQDTEILWDYQGNPY